jgi:hypothetical protein
MKLNLKKIALGTITLTASQLALATSGTGGMAAATSTASAIETAAFALLGVLALLYMMYMALMAFTEKKSWTDFGWAAVHVALAGASVAIATWAWTLFSA